MTLCVYAGWLQGARSAWASFEIASEWAPRTKASTETLSAAPNHQQWGGEREGGESGGGETNAVEALEYDPSFVGPAKLRRCVSPSHTIFFFEQARTSHAHARCQVRL